MTVSLNQVSFNRNI